MKSLFPFLTFWEFFVNPKLRVSSRNFILLLWSDFHLWRCRLLFPDGTTREKFKIWTLTVMSSCFLCFLLESPLCVTVRGMWGANRQVTITKHLNGRRAVAVWSRCVQSHVSPSSAAAWHRLLFSFQQRRQRTSCVTFCAFCCQWFTCFL